MKHKEKYNIIVIGGGHAGIEAACSAAKMGLNVLLISLSINKIGLTPCNPSIGGSAKGIVVKEIDALGGVMGKIADMSCLQIKFLNTSRGPAVRSLRSQIDKILYPQNALKVIQQHKNIEVLEDKVIELLIDEKNKVVKGVKCNYNGEILSDSVILTTGTYMDSLIYQGNNKKHEGPEKQETTKYLSQQLKKIGFKLIRLKTGTPARVAKETVDYNKCIEEKGLNNNKICFSYSNQKIENPNLSCWLTYTNKQVHELLLKNLNKSSMFCIKNIGKGPRYCPSIEDKVVRFKDRKRHQIFLEPESQLTNSIYLQGLPTSMPENIQKQMIHLISGLENCKILRYGYAIEYDAILPWQLKYTFETKLIKNLYSAGQINGTSGYEEAAAQGLIAGINASAKILKKPELILKRYDAYIGVLIDDLISKESNEPYRLLTSLAEYRLLLRNDNADLRLFKHAYLCNLISDKRYHEILLKVSNIKKIIEIINKTNLSKNFISNNFPNENITQNKIKTSLFLKRPKVKLKNIISCLNLNFKPSFEELEQAEINIKYQGYIKIQNIAINKIKKVEKKQIPIDFNYKTVSQLSKESFEKLNLIKPKNLAQLQKISGIRPHDILNIAYELKKIKAR